MIWKFQTKRIELRRQAQRALRLARGITDDRAAQALKASASPIDGLTSKTKSKRIKRQAQRFLGWREKKRPKMKRVHYWDRASPSKWE